MIFELLTGFLTFFIIIEYLPKLLNKYCYLDNSVSKSYSNVGENSSDSDFSELILEVPPFIKIPKTIDLELTKFMDDFWKTYIRSWSRNAGFSVDFEEETKYIIRIAINNLIVALKKVDLSRFLLDRIIPLATSHLSICLSYSQQLERTTNCRQLFEEIMGSNVHPALGSKELTENSYQKFLAQAIIKKIVPSSVLNTKKVVLFITGLVSQALFAKIVDFLSDPESLNEIFYSLFSVSQTVPEPVSTDISMVPLLYQFQSWKENSLASLSSPLNVIRIPTSDLEKNPFYSSKFQAHLEKYRMVKTNNFRIIFEQFNEQQISTQEILSHEAKEAVVNQANIIYKSYLLDKSDDRIPFPADFISFYMDTFQNNNGSYEKIKDVNRSFALFFLVYAHTKEMIEGYCMRLFYQSDEFYSIIMKQSAKTMVYSMAHCLPDNFFHLSWSSRHSSTSFRDKGFSSHRSTGSNASMNLFHDEITSLESGDTMESLDDDKGIQISNADECNPDDKLSDMEFELLEEQEENYIENETITLFAEIIQTKFSQDGQKLIFDVRVRECVSNEHNSPNTDSISEQSSTTLTQSKPWIVSRTYDDFVALNRFLQNIYGNLSILELVPRKNSLSKLETEFKKYLRGLMSHPHIKYALSLQKFLSKDFNTDKSKFIDAVSNSGMNPIQSFIEAVNIKKSTKSYQSIDSYMNRIAGDVENIKPKNPKYLSPKYPLIELKNLLIKKREAVIPRLVALYPSSKKNPAMEHRREDLQFGVIWRLADFVYRLVKYPLSLSYYAKVALLLLERFIEFFFIRNINSAVKDFTEYTNIAYLINKSRETLFAPATVPIDRKSSCPSGLPNSVLAQRAFINWLPDKIRILVDEGNLNASVERFQQILNYPLFNKQLVYILLDEVVSHIFPDLATAD